MPNVLYKVANESSGDGSVEPGFLEAIGLSGPPDWGDSTEWQYWVIAFVKRYEAQMGYARHPVGMTMQYPVRDQSKVNDVLFDSPADWISPGFDAVESPMESSRWLTDPPANDGAKVIISDTDSIRWHSVVNRDTKDAGTVKVEDGGNTTFATPFAKAGPVVLHLKRDGNRGATTTTFGGRTRPVVPRVGHGVTPQGGGRGRMRSWDRSQRERRTAHPSASLR